MADVTAGEERERLDTVRRLEQAADQVAGWTERRRTLARQAFALGVPQHAIAAHARVDQATVSRMLDRTPITTAG